MLQNANLTINAWHQSQLVGIRKRLIDETKTQLGKEYMVVLLAHHKPMTITQS